MNRARARVAVASAALLALTSVATGCSGSSVNPEAPHREGPIQIGIMWPTSGVLKLVGEDFGKGWDLYLKQHNNKLGGFDVKVTSVDESDNKQAAIDGTKKLISEDKVEVIVGGVSSDAQVAINKAATEAKIPYIGTGGRPDIITDFSYTWYVSHLNSDPGVSLAAYVKKAVGDGSVWAMGPDFVGGYSYVNPFVGAFTKAGGKLANPDGKPTFVPYPTTTNFIPYLNQIVASGAKAVYCFFAGSMAIAFIKQYGQVIGKTIPLYVAGPTTEGNALLAGMGPSADGVYSSNDYAPDLDNPANRAFASAFQNEYTATTAQGNVLGWDAAQVLDLAIAAAGPNPTSESINAAVAKLGAIPSPRGDWRFGANHAPIQQWYLRQVRQDGRGLANVVIQPLTTLGQ